MRCDGALFALALRREGGSNPRSRDCGTTVFETAAFDHSAISPILFSRIRHGVYPAMAGPSLQKFVKSNNYSTQY